MRATWWGKGLAVVVVVVVAAVVVAVVVAHRASAVPRPGQYLFSNVQVATDSRGRFTVPASDLGLVIVNGVICGGASPRTGPAIPATVVCYPNSDLTAVVGRVFHLDGRPFAGAPRINIGYYPPTLES